MIRRTRAGVSEKRLPAAFYRTEAGNEPVREWLKSDVLTPDDRRRIGEDIKTVEFGWPVGMPVCRPMGNGLWEVRTGLADRIARIFFCVNDGRMVLLHGFIKKSQRTLESELALALDRKRKVEKQR